MSESPTERRAWRTDEAWNRLSERIAAEAVHPRRPWRAIRWRWAAAALAAAVVALTVLPRLGRSRTAVDERTVRTAAGERLVVRLSDSSVITLGPATTLRVRTSGERRGVALDGEAQFNVVHDARRAFVVTAGTARATDLGTRFVVRAYPGDSTVQVAVTDGVVSLSSDRAAITLHSGDVGFVGRDGSVRGIPSQLAAAYTAWVEGRLSFDNAPLSSVAAELERWFDVDVRITDSTLARRRITATYRDARLGDVLGALATTLHAEYTRTGRSVVISPSAAGAGEPAR
ncbi:MAG: FecR family protein [Gemmatimonadales bacterium]